MADDDEDARLKELTDRLRLLEVMDDFSDRIAAAITAAENAKNDRGEPFMPRPMILQLLALTTSSYRIGVKPFRAAPMLALHEHENGTPAPRLIKAMHAAGMAATRDGEPITARDLSTKLGQWKRKREQIRSWSPLKNAELDEMDARFKRAGFEPTAEVSEADWFARLLHVTVIGDHAKAQPSL